MKNHNLFQRYLAFSNMALILSWLFLLVALITLHYTEKHFPIVIMVSIFLLTSDLLTYWGSSSKKNQAMMLCLFADIPVVCSFVCLAIFYFFNHPDKGVIFPLSDNGQLNTLEYFISGTISFQWLASNFIVMVIIWGEYFKWWDAIAGNDNIVAPPSV